MRQASIFHVRTAAAQVHKCSRNYGTLYLIQCLLVEVDFPGKFPLIVTPFTDKGRERIRQQKKRVGELNVNIGQSTFFSFQNVAFMIHLCIKNT